MKNFSAGKMRFALAKASFKASKKTRAFLGKTLRFKPLRKLVWRGEKRKVLKYTSLPSEIKSDISFILAFRGAKAQSIALVIVGAGNIIFPPWYSKAIGAVGIGAGVFVTKKRNKEVVHATEQLGHSLFVSKDKRIVKLRNLFKYIVVDIEGNLVGTIKSLFWGK